MIIMFTSDKYEMLYIYIYIYIFFFFHCSQKKKKKDTSWTCFNIYDKKEMLICIWKTIANETGSWSPCMRPRSDPPNFGPIERGEKQTNNID